MDRENGAYPIIPIMKRIDDDADYDIILHLHLKKGIHYLMPLLPVKGVRGQQEQINIRFPVAVAPRL